jgi:hypothetical protein
MAEYLRSEYRLDEFGLTPHIYTLEYRRFHDLVPEDRIEPHTLAQLGATLVF